MTNEIFSNHIGGASELTVLASIKQEFVPCRTLISYPARLRRHLRMLSALRRIGLEGRRAGVYLGPLDGLRTLQYIRWTLIDNDTRMLLAVNFDRPLEPYLRRIVDIGGPLLDTILCHCHDFEGRSSDQGFHNFMEYATTHQAPIELFAATAPDHTVDDGDFFVEMDRQLRLDETTLENIANHRVKTPDERTLEASARTPLSLLDQSLSIIQALYENAHLFSDDTSEYRDDLLYYRLVETLTPGFWRGLYGRFGPLFGLQVADPYNMTDGELTSVFEAVKLAATGNIPAPPTSSMSPEELKALQARMEKLKPALPLLGRHVEALAWYAKRPRPRDLAPSTPPALDPNSIQNGLISPPLKSDVACLMMLRVDDPASGRAFLTWMEEKLWDCSDDVQYNLSLTLQGLQALKINKEVLSFFPAAFREGMAARAGLLGDIDVNNPSQWVWLDANWVSVDGKMQEGPGHKVAPGTIDMIVQVASWRNSLETEFNRNHPLFEEIREIAECVPGVSLVAVEPMVRSYATSDRKHVVGHLGFQDGISQPKFRAPEAADTGEYDVVNLARRQNGQPPVNEQERDTSLHGDILLGHPSKMDLDFSKDRSVRERADQIKPYQSYAGTALENGTFQVIRKLKVDSEAFDKVTRRSGATCDKPSVQELMIGRHRDGTPLTGGHTQDFNYANDTDRPVVPLQSHIRRANPREADTPRILRRGFSYGPFDDAKADRGLMFIAYNANISEQFEVIQRWISGGNSTGIPSYHGDPLLAPGRSDSNRIFRYFDNKKLEHADPGHQPPVTVRWGLYAFTPSRDGIRYLIENPPLPDALRAEPATPPTGRLTDSQQGGDFAQWQLALEDVDEDRRGEREQIWAEIRSKGGVQDIGAYGVLVGSADGVSQVLKNEDDAFSVREYWSRMKDTTGLSYLGFDRCPVALEPGDPYPENVKPGDYEASSKLVNEYVAYLNPEQLYKDAFDAAQAWITSQATDPHYVPGLDGDGDLNIGGNRQRVVSGRFFYDLVAELCRKWFGMPGLEAGVQLGGPDGTLMDKVKAPPHCPIDMVRGSFFIFWPHPSDATEAASKDRTGGLRDAVRAHIANGATPPADTLFDSLAKVEGQSAHDIADAIVGACSGFAGPTTGSFRATLFDMIDTGMLWRLQQRLLATGDARDYTAALKILAPEILSSMAKRAAPDLLHRKVVKDVTIGKQTVAKGKTVIVSLKSAIADGAQDADSNAAMKAQSFYLFGGDYGGPSHHACSGRDMAISTMMGALAAIMSAGDLRNEGPLNLQVYPFATSGN